MSEIIELEVRTYELDGYNHVNNAVYLNYLEYARIEFLKRIGFKYTDMIEDGYMLYVSRIDIQYKHSARLFDKLLIEVEPIKLGKLSGTFRQVIRNKDDAICAEAEVSWACVDKVGKPARIPEKYLVKGLIPSVEKPQP